MSARSSGRIVVAAVAIAVLLVVVAMLLLASFGLSVVVHAVQRWSARVAAAAVATGVVVAVAVAVAAVAAVAARAANAATSRGAPAALSLAGRRRGRKRTIAPAAARWRAPASAGRAPRRRPDSAAAGVDAARGGRGRGRRAGGPRRRRCAWPPPRVAGNRERVTEAEVADLEAGRGGGGDARGAEDAQCAGHEDTIAPVTGSDARGGRRAQRSPVSSPGYGQRRSTDEGAVMAIVARKVVLGNVQDASGMATLIDDGVFTADEVIAVILEAGHSRLPVYGADRDEIAGHAIELNRSRKMLETKLQALKLRKGTLSTQLAVARSADEIRDRSARAPAVALHGVLEAQRAAHPPTIPDGAPREYPGLRSTKTITASRC